MLNMPEDGKLKTSKAMTAREIAFIGIFTALTAVLAQIAVPLPFTPMPISFGLVAVYITGIFLLPKHAVMTQLCYLLVGAAGAPVFSNFRGGIGALFGNTGGFLMAYPVMAGIVALALNNRKSRQSEQSRNKIWTYFISALSMCFAHTILYAAGTLWYCAITGITFRAAFAVAVQPFIILDIVKIAFCVIVIVPLRSRFISMGLLLT